MKNNEERFECLSCADLHEIDGIPCQECCEHAYEPDEGFICEYCGEQGEPADVWDEDAGLER